MRARIDVDLSHEPFKKCTYVMEQRGELEAGKSRVEGMEHAACPQADRCLAEGANVS